MTDDGRKSPDGPQFGRAADRRRIETSLRQALTGVHTGSSNLRVECLCCSRSMAEGEVVGVYAQRPVDALEWRPTRWYCNGCARREIETPTLGISEAIITARLAVVSLSREQRHRLCLSAVEVLAFSPASADGSR